MPESLTESFCERCGTRYTFRAPARLNSLRRARGMVAGLKRYVMSSDSLSESVSDALHDETESLADRQLEAFHRTFNFCITCRQYACKTCWNDAQGRCLTCAPAAGSAPEPEAWPDRDVAAVARLEQLTTEQLDAVSRGPRDSTHPAASAAARSPFEPLEWPVSPPVGRPAPEDATRTDAVAPREPATRPRVEDAWPEADIAARLSDLAEPATTAPADVVEQATEPAAFESASRATEPLEEPAVVAATEPEDDSGPTGARAPDEPASTTQIELEPIAVADHAAEPVAAAPDADAPSADPSSDAEVETPPADRWYVGREVERVEVPLLDVAAAPSLEIEQQPEPRAAETVPILPAAGAAEPAVADQTQDGAFPELPAERLAAVLDTPEARARRQQLELLGLSDSTDHHDVAAPRAPVFAARADRERSGSLAPESSVGSRVAALWAASTREVASATPVAPVGVQECAHCGLALSANARFCRRCGMRQVRSG